ncbi:hypothetical protein JCM19314_1354 [Nonlabens ulvanivorans]|uniref:Uncharacterized protein n=1 Tax=Nonlabens ulvanivorans TaxID=906888 RepID=A0A090QEP0_NONUL|nr:hypothetical protein JCM19314_1354 [Nonlabens ulvanivorans]
MILNFYFHFRESDMKCNYIKNSIFLHKEYAVLSFCAY